MRRYLTKNRNDGTYRSGRTHRFRILFMVAALILTLSQICPAQPAEAEDYPAELLQWASDRANWLESRYESSLAQAAALQNEKEKLSGWVHAALMRELLAGYDLLGNIPEDAAWLVRVNQGTCTVTVYRVFEAEKEKIPFYGGVDSIVKSALEEARKAALEQAESASDSAQDGETKSGDAAGEDGQEKPVLREFHRIVLRQLRRTDAPAEESAPDAVRIMLPVYACVCSVGANGGTPNGTFTVYDHLRWHELVGPTWGQWCCHFAPSYLFHSLPYDRPNDPNSLQKDVYNLLGTAASHGCIRLAAVDAKYIYDHIPSGGKVEIFEGTARDDPLGTPMRPYIGEWEETYDPTDPEFRPE